MSVEHFLSESDPLLSAGTVADIVGLSPATLRRYRFLGSGPPWVRPPDYREPRLLEEIQEIAEDAAMQVAADEDTQRIDDREAHAMGSGEAT